MGNYVSCAASTVPSKMFKVVLPNGSVQEFHRRVKAAELMLENPQQFVCHANGLQIGRRINPLLADEDLELGQLYFLLPMQKLKGVLSGTDMASLAFKANSATKGSGHGKNNAKILPLLFGDMLPERRKDADLLMDEKAQELPRLNLEDDPDLSTAFEQLRLSGCRAWKPKLETISESRPKLRDLMQSNEQFC
ncbi:hypothetical protein SUGI_0940800 [Cryptomeria japonica]|nr:hypothetical protein SUGI_0940800 [Cryptomeria japonica]